MTKSSDEALATAIGVFIGVCLLVLLVLSLRCVAIWFLWNFIVCDLLPSAEPCSIWQAIGSSVLLFFILPNPSNAKQCTD